MKRLDQCNQINAFVFTLNIPFHTVRVGTDEIPLSQSAKYFEITLDSKLKWGAHISEKKAVVSKKLRKLFYILNKESAINLETKRLVYNWKVRPMWTYSLVIWE